MAQRTLEDIKQYQKDYYRKHRDKIRANRKHRYATNDRAYREGALQRARERYEQFKKERPETSRYEIVDANGQVFSTIGQLSTVINRSLSTIRKYHQRGIIPTPTQYDTRGWRLYTATEVALLKQAFTDFDAGLIPNLKTLARQIKKGWTTEVKKSGKARASRPHKN